MTNQQQQEYRQVQQQKVVLLENIARHYTTAANALKKTDEARCFKEMQLAYLLEDKIKGKSIQELSRKLDMEMSSLVLERGKNPVQYRAFREIHGIYRASKSFKADFV